MELSQRDIEYMVTESVKRIIKEQYEDKYDAYVLVDDSDGSIIGNYAKQYDSSAMYNAIEDAKVKAMKNPYSTYTVYGCINNKYDEDTIIYTADNNNLGNHNGFWLGMRKR